MEHYIILKYPLDTRNKTVPVVPGSVPIRSLFCDLMSIIYLQLTNMASGVDLLMYFNTSCVECSDMGPPPDTILGIPPPPLPAFLQRAPFINNTSTCSVLCDWTAGPGVEYVELPRHGTAQSFSLSDDKAVCNN